MRKPHPLQKPFFDNIDAIRADLLAGELLSDMAVKYGIKYSTISLNAKKLWGFKPRRGKIPYSGPCIDCGSDMDRDGRICRKCTNKRGLKARGGGNGPRRGPDSPSWKGGIALQNDRLKPEYAEWRKSVFARDNYTCRMCGVRGGKLVADHIIPFCFLKDFRFFIENGQTLCDDCHKKTPTYGEKAKRFGSLLGRWYIAKNQARYDDWLKAREA